MTQQLITELTLVLNFDMVFKKRDEIVTREIAGETLLVPIRDKLADMQRIFALSSAAKYVWQELDGGKPWARFEMASYLISPWRRSGWMQTLSSLWPSCSMPGWL